MLERVFEITSGRLAALHFQAQQGSPCRRLLAVHGWLDNAASFGRLAAELPDCEILAVDLAGHGRSPWRGPGASYALVDHLPDLLEVLDQLGWARCALLGHSMGGAIGALLAVAAPDRVEALISIDALGPISLPEAEAPARLARALKARFEPRPGRRVFASVDDATEQRAKLNSLTVEAARALVERGLVEVPGGWSWAADPRLQLPSPAPMSEAQVQAVLAAIVQPMLVLAAGDPDPRLPRLNIEARRACVAHARFEQLSGGHHLHLAEPAAAARVIREFLDSLAD
jgi:pimeloyl-ACP methyl ester carboxylesterase